MGCPSIAGPFCRGARPHYNYQTLADVLLAHGAPVDEPMDDGASPLYVACMQGHAEVEEDCFARASPATQKKNARDRLHYAASRPRARGCPSGPRCAGRRADGPWHRWGCLTVVHRLRERSHGGRRAGSPTPARTRSARGPMAAAVPARE